MSSGVPSNNVGDNTLKHLNDVAITLPINDGEVIVFDAGANKWINGVAGMTLEELQDVDVPAPTNGEVLTYNTATSKWVAAASGSGATTLAALTDVDIPAPTSGHTLTFNGTSSKWESAPTQIQLSDVGGVEFNLPLANAEGLVYNVSMGKWTNEQIVLQNGNSFGVPLTIGTNDSQPLVLETEGISRVTIVPTPLDETTLVLMGTGYAGVVTPANTGATDAAGIYLRPGGVVDGLGADVIVTGSTVEFGGTGTPGDVHINGGDNTNAIGGDVHIQAGNGVNPSNSGAVQITTGAGNLRVEPSGLIHTSVVDYKDLVLANGDIPDKGYVDGLVAGIELDDLTDVVIATPANGQALVYNSTSTKWENTALPSGVTTLAALTDVALGTPSNGQTLTYNSGTSKWNSVTPETTSVSNVGVGGVGVFKQMSGTTIELKNVRANSSKVTVTNDIPLDTVDIDLGTVVLNDLNDVQITSATSGDILRHNGVEFINTPERVETSSNVNVGGVGVFKQKTGNNFEFRGINAGSAKVTVTNDSGNNEIDVDLGTVNLDDLGDVIISGPSAGQLIRYNGTNWLNSNLVDSTTVFVDDVDPSKGMVFQLSGITTLNQRVLTVPDASGTIALTTSSWQLGGNATGTAASFGTTTNQAVNFITNNLQKMQLSNAATPTLNFNGNSIIGNSVSTGTLTISTGLASGATPSGLLWLTTGAGASAGTGNILIQPGAGNTGAGTSGSVNILSGTGQTTGAVTLSTSNATGRSSGSITINTGDSGNSDNFAVGNISIQTGTCGSLGTNTGGSIFIKASSGVGAGGHGTVDIAANKTTSYGIRLVNSGLMSVLNTPNYHTLVTSDNDIPNLKAIKDNAFTMTNKTLLDTSTVIANTTDPTKSVKFLANSIGTGTQQTVTFQNATGVMPLANAPMFVSLSTPMDGDSLVYNNSLSVWQNRMMSCPVGELWYQNDTGSVVTLTTQNTWYLINPPDTLETNASAFPSAQFDNPSDGRLRYIGTHTQAFHTAFSWCSATGNAGDVWEFEIQKNGTPVAGSKITCDMVTNNTYTSFAFHKVVPMANNDYLELWVRNISQNNRTMTFKNVNFVCMGTMMY